MRMRWWWWQIMIVIIEQERWHVLEKNLLEFTVKKWKYKIKKETKRKKTKHSKEVDLAGVGNDYVW